MATATYAELPAAMPDGTLIEYREIAGFAGYFVGSDGSIWSRRGFTRGRPGAVVVLMNRWRRLSVKLRDARPVLTLRAAPGGRTTGHPVHRLVLESFVGPCPPGMEACHADGDCTNNRLSNLRWDSRKGNIRDRRLHGTQGEGSSAPFVRLTEAQVWRIHRLRQAGLSRATIAEMTGVPQPNVSQILSGRTWKHVKALFDVACPTAPEGPDYYSI